MRRSNSNFRINGIKELIDKTQYRLCAGLRVWERRDVPVMWDGMNVGTTHSCDCVDEGT